MNVITAFERVLEEAVRAHKFACSEMTSYLAGLNEGALDATEDDDADLQERAAHADALRARADAALAIVGTTCFSADVTLEDARAELQELELEGASSSEHNAAALHTRLAVLAERAGKLKDEVDSSANPSADTPSEVPRPPHSLKWCLARLAEHSGAFDRQEDLEERAAVLARVPLIRNDADAQPFKFEGLNSNLSALNILKEEIDACRMTRPADDDAARAEWERSWAEWEAFRRGVPRRSVADLRAR
jgi:hypothetical protein